MQELGSALKKALKQNGMDRAIHQNKTMFLWKEIVGEKIAKNCQPLETRNNKLIVKASTPVWRNEIDLKKPELVKKINKVLGKNTIKDIRII